MILYSTNDKSVKVSFREAVIKGLADDGGLFMPSELPALPGSFIEKLNNIRLPEIAYEVSYNLLKDEIPAQDLRDIVERAITFDAPLAKLDEDKYILELFHGPTLAFKDFGARFMAKTLEYFNRNSDKEVIILVATSGDTGSAVANGFYKTEGVKVVLLYPSGKVSRIQEQQLTTLGENITALEVEGTFDDCQRLVKSAFSNEQLSSRIKLSSANSINIARLLPQSFYYFNAFARTSDSGEPVIFSVPSGNFGNLTAGLFAEAMGLPVEKFIAATNANDVFTQYIRTGKYIPRPSVRTLSNAMDVGDPSNFARIQALYGNDYGTIKKKIESYSFSDEETKKGISEIQSKYGYIIDPHGSVGVLALDKYFEERGTKENAGIVLETAHPAKFKDIVEDAAGIRIEIPERLASCMGRQKQSKIISNNFDEFKEYLLSSY